MREKGKVILMGSILLYTICKIPTTTWLVDTAIFNSWMGAKGQFFPALSAYDVNQHYLEDVKGIFDAYNRSLDKSYGVRDEYCCRARSFKRLLPYLRQKVSGSVFGIWPTWFNGLKPCFTAQEIHRRDEPHHLALKLGLVHIHWKEGQGD